MTRLSAVVLAVALLASIAPIGVSSHAQLCSMPCCSGGSCSTGACDRALGNPIVKAKPDTHCEHNGGPAEVEIVEVSQSAEPDESEHCGMGHSASSSSSTPRQSTATNERIVRQDSFSRPCSSDCCAGAAVSSLLRRSRDLAIVSEPQKPRPPPNFRHTRNFQHPLYLGLQWRRQSPPRAPPTALSNA